MYSISAISLTSRVNDWLASSCHPHVLHVFDRACNLINERREVLSIVTTQIGNGPFNLVVEDGTCFSEHLSFESQVSHSQTELRLGDLVVQTANAKCWCAYPDWQRLHFKRNDILKQLTKLLITSYLNSSGLDTFPETTQRYPPQSLVSNLSCAFASADISNAKKLASKLAGLGTGLTPAGDDILMGAMYAAWIIHPHKVAGTLAQAVADIATPLTTSLSAAWLRSAGEGEAGVLWHEFFDALLISLIGNSTYVQDAMQNILFVGETSGADALVGFYSTMTAWAASPHPK
jgi:hypothetical protein